ncbi:MAG: protein kinase [Pseudomonadota bacterium]
MRGQYTIESYLNSGGFGITYCASDSLGRTVVIKECFPTIMCQREGTKIAPRKIEYAVELSKLIEQFVSEAHALAAMKHKNILHVHQVFEENDTAYMAIDFIDGPDLMDVIQTEPDRLSPEEILRLTRRTLGAIKYIHDKGILHRDISPDNILIDEQGEPVLIDFGAALRSNTVPNRVFSKVKFVKDGYSPQEFYIEGSDQGTYSDIYGFAATIYHAISGAPPVDGQQRLSAVAQGHDDPYVPLAGTSNDYPGGFLEAIDTALSIMPGDRLQTADEWLDLIPARPTRIVSKRAPAPKRRTRPTVTNSQQTKTRLLPDSLAPLDIVEDTDSAETDFDADKKASAPQDLPDDEDIAPLALSMDADDADETGFEEDLYLDEEDDTPVDLRALMPASAIAQQQPHQPEVPAHGTPDVEIATDPDPDALPEDDTNFDDMALGLELEPNPEVEADAAFDPADGADDAAHDHPVETDTSADTDEDDPLDPLETAIAETTEGSDGALEKRISRIVTQAIEQDDTPEHTDNAPAPEPAPEPADDTALILLEPEDDDKVAALRPVAGSGQGKLVIGGAAAALVLIAGVGAAMLLRGPGDAAETTASAAGQSDAAVAPSAPALAAAPAPDEAPGEPEIAPSLAAGAASSAPSSVPAAAPAAASVANDTPPLAFSIANVPAELRATIDTAQPGVLPNIQTPPVVPGSSTLPVASTGELAFAPNQSAEPPVTFAIGPTEVIGLDLGTLAAAPVLATAGTDSELASAAADPLAIVETDAEPQAVAALTRPETQLDGVAGPQFAFDVQIAADALPVLAEAGEAPRAEPLDTLENVVASAGVRPRVDAIPPAPLPRTPVAAVQVLGAHWDVAMPFASEVEQVRNADTARITQVTDAQTALKSGAWVVEGTVIFSLNGANLRPGLPLSAHLLDNLVVDPDGYTRASVRYRDAATGRFDLGLLTIPVIRDISLADQTRIRYRTVDGAWVMEVASVGVQTDTGFQTGDILLREETTGIGIANEEALRAVYDRLVADQIGDARFVIDRAGTQTTLRVPLVRNARP